MWGDGAGLVGKYSIVGAAPCWPAPPVGSGGANFCHFQSWQWELLLRFAGGSFWVWWCPVGTELVMEMARTAMEEEVEPTGIDRLEQLMLDTTEVA